MPFKEQDCCHLSQSMISKHSTINLYEQSPPFGGYLSKVVSLIRSLNIYLTCPYMHTFQGMGSHG